MDIILLIRCLSFGVTYEKFDIMKKTAVIGVGNILFFDDGIGVYVVRCLRENYTFEPLVELVDGGALGFGLFEYFREYDDVLLLDALSLEDVAGSIYEIPSHELLGLGGYKKTAHEVEVVQMLEVCELHDAKANITLFGIVPQDITTPKIGLSEVLKGRFELLVQTVIGALEELGVNVVQKGSLDLDAIITKF